MVTEACWARRSSRSSIVSRGLPRSMGDPQNCYAAAPLRPVFVVFAVGGAAAGAWLWDLWIAAGG